MIFTKSPCIFQDFSFAIGFWIDILKTYGTKPNHNVFENEPNCPNGSVSFFGLATNMLTPISKPQNHLLHFIPLFSNLKTKKRQINIKKTFKTWWRYIPVYFKMKVETIYIYFLGREHEGNQLRRPIASSFHLCHLIITDFIVSSCFEEERDLGKEVRNCELRIEIEKDKRRHKSWNRAFGAGED